MSEPGPFVSRLDAKFADLANRYQQHEKYREMRSLAIKLESRLINLEKESSHKNKSQFSQKLEADPRLKKRYLESVEKMRNEAHELLISEQLENQPCFEAWAVFKPDGKLVETSIRIGYIRCLEDWSNADNDHVYWSVFEKQGYTCEKIEIRRIRKAMNEQGV